MRTDSEKVNRRGVISKLLGGVALPYVSKLGGPGAGEAIPSFSWTDDISGKLLPATLGRWESPIQSGIKQQIFKKICDLPSPAPADITYSKTYQPRETEMVYLDPSGIIAIPEEEPDAELSL